MLAPPLSRLGTSGVTAGTQGISQPVLGCGSLKKEMEGEGNSWSHKQKMTVVKIITGCIQRMACKTNCRFKN